MSNSRHSETREDSSDYITAPVRRNPDYISGRQETTSDCRPAIVVVDEVGLERTVAVGVGAGAVGDGTLARRWQCSGGGQQRMTNHCRQRAVRWRAVLRAGRPCSRRLSITDQTAARRMVVDVELTD